MSNPKCRHCSVDIVKEHVVFEGKSYHPRCIARQHLLKAAPELLEACLKALGFIGTLNIERPSDVIDALSDAIDKARVVK